MTKTTSRLPLLAAAAALAMLMADIASAHQHRDHTTVPGNSSVGSTTLQVTGGGTGDAEMEHRDMGGIGAPGAVQDVGHVLGGTGNAEMDHAAMGAIQGSSGWAAVGPTAGGGTGEADILRAPGVGAPRT